MYDNVFEMCTLSFIFFPLVNFLFAGFFGRSIGKWGVRISSLVLMWLTFTHSVALFFRFGLSNNSYYLTAGTWVTSGLFTVNWGFLIDSLTVSMFIVVNSISLLVHLYSVAYMAEDPHAIRFLSYLSLFTFFMLILVSADNFIQMFLGWEGVGLCSYLLISFWFTRVQANKAAIKALLVNRVGDFGLTLGIILIFCHYKSTDFSVVFCLAPYHNNCESLNNLACSLLFIGAIGKSAQVGLHTWLPDAMEGPTPVSALIHAATMVTAGVFLIVRCSPLFEMANSTLILIAFFGSATAFFAATLGLVQNDLKKVIAYSTCSQLGYMVFACGLSGYSASLFHLFNHAFFKALLFLSAGVVIHGLANEQDMRRMGGLKGLMPFAYVMITVGSLSLTGFPFLTGFYSKDYILEFSAASSYDVAPVIFWFGTSAAFLTAAYSFRLIYLVFFSRANMYWHSAKEINHGVPFTMAIPLIILCFGSIFLGYFSKDIFIGFGSPFLGNAIPMIDSYHHQYFSEEFVPFRIKLLPLWFSGLGVIFMSSLINLPIYFAPGIFEKFLRTSWRKSLYKFLVHKWHFDTIYNNYINYKLLFFGKDTTFVRLDKGLLEFLGPHGIPEFIYGGAVSLNLLPRNIIKQATFMVFSSLFITYGFILSQHFWESLYLIN